MLTEKKDLHVSKHVPKELADREEGPACIKACTKRAITVADPEKIRAKNQEKYLAKMAGLYEPDGGKGGFVHVITSQARARLVLDE